MTDSWREGAGCELRIYGETRQRSDRNDALQYADAQWAEIDSEKYARWSVLLVYIDLIKQKSIRDSKRRISNNLKAVRRGK